MEPKATIIISTYNRCESLDRCLDSLMKQSFKNYEIIVVDGGSRDNTINVLERYPVKVIVDDTKNLSYVYNLAWRNARGEIIIFIDDDIEAKPSWLENLIGAFDKYKDVSAVGGPTIATRRQEMMALYEAVQNSILLKPLAKIYSSVIAEDKLLDVGLIFMSGAYSIGGSLWKSARLKGPVYVGCLTTTNMGIRKSVLEKINFDENFLFCHMDGDLFIRLRRANHKLLFNPKAIVLHHISFSGSSKNPYYLGMDFALFYMKNFNFNPKTISNILRMTLNVIYFNAYWIYKGLTTKKLNYLYGIFGFLTGFLNYFKIRNRLK